MKKDTTLLNSSKTSLSPEDFTKKVEHIINEIVAHKATNPIIVSDVIDKRGNQYVDLVQKGGGVLGIALVGYTYVLEKAGIRFRKLAGTSAGAINTALMTVIGEKNQPKSVEILKIISSLNFFNLVDGHPLAKSMIKLIISEGGIDKIKKWKAWLTYICIILLAGNILFLGLEKVNPNYGYVTKTFFIVSGFLLVVITFIIFYGLNLSKRLKNNGFGINPGNYFYDWVKYWFCRNDVIKVSDFINKAEMIIPDVYLRDNRTDSDGINKGDVALITSELVTQNKIQFPANCNLFRDKADIDNLQPAGFVRASMAIPVFFESYFIDKIPVESEDVQKAWKKLNVSRPPSKVRFVDGGLLSNFPINIFYNPGTTIPRLPTFGIDLDDRKEQDVQPDPEGWSTEGYLGKLLNTMRSYYDKEFLIKNQHFQKGIGTIKLPGYNWLDFAMEDKMKFNLFIAGAEAARDFLLGNPSKNIEAFNWADYKQERKEIQTGEAFKAV